MIRRQKQSSRASDATLTLRLQGATAMIKFNGINHLAMVTSDMDKTIRYWRDLLGFRLVAGLGAPGYRHYFFEISP
ncbi:MAG: VOC family protein, partial [Desulfomonilaceae bacterium]